MEMLRSACAIYHCEDCEHVTGGQCPGCLAGNRQLKDAGERFCAVFGCVETHGLESCETCTEQSCLQKRTVELVCPLRSRFETMRWWAGRMARTLEARKPAEPEAKSTVEIPPRVVSRLRLYLMALGSLAEEGVGSVSSWQLAERVGVKGALIRKDLSRFGDFGTPSFGYHVDFLMQRIKSILRLDQPRGLLWIGAGCFGLHAAAIKRLEGQGCRVCAVFDTDPGVIGTRVGGFEVLSIDRLAEAAAGSSVIVAALAVQGPQAAPIADMLVRSGATAILNMSGQLLVLPDSVPVCNLDPIGELLEAVLLL